MHYQTFRSVSDVHVFVVCLDGSFYERVPDDMRRLGPWQGNRRGAAEALCDACDDDAARFCAIGALIRSAYVMTGDQEQAHRLGWKVAGLLAIAANLRRVDEDEPGWSLAVLSDRRGQAAVLSAFDTLIVQGRA
jgi:hypothetical protein